MPPKSLVPQPEPGSLLPRELGSCMFWGPACFGGPHYSGIPVPIWGPKSFTQQLPRSHIPVIHSLRAPCPLDLGAFLGSRRTGTPRVSGVPPAHRLGAGWERGLCGTDGRKDGREPAPSLGQPRKSRHREREQAGPGHFGEKRSQTRRLHPHGCHGMGGAGWGVRGRAPTGEGSGLPPPSQPSREGGKRAGMGVTGPGGGHPAPPFGKVPRRQPLSQRGEWKLEEKEPGARRSGARGG